MARLQLSERELHVLRTALASAFAGVCIPDWELEALLGCSPGRVKRSLDAGIRRLETRGERPVELTCERMVLLLSVVLGASPQRDEVLEGLIARLGSQERSPLQSGISLRQDVVPARRAQRR